MYTIQRAIGRLDGIKVGLVGDLANGRAVRSLAYLLARYKDVKIYFVSPDVVKMKDDIKDYLTSTGVEWEENTDLVEVASKCDVVSQTRIQRERFGERLDLYEAARGKYVVDKNILQAMQKHGCSLASSPKIAVEVDGDPRAAYFRQAKNGLFIRMALLKLLLLGLHRTQTSKALDRLVTKLLESDNGGQLPGTICCVFILVFTAEATDGLLPKSNHNSLQRGVQTGRDKHGEKVIDQERAASTAEEFLKIAEEKAEQGIGSQTADEAADHVVEEITSDPGGDIDATKEKQKPGTEEEAFIKTPK
uniref:aspartate carbamoyltransferase n=1 Tax=Kalanchoe fedtschenkoi TaxID=63787 RepID=A0A7N0ZXX4_KALFE